MFGSLNYDSSLRRRKNSMWECYEMASDVYDLILTSNYRVDGKTFEQ